MTDLLEDAEWTEVTGFIYSAKVGETYRGALVWNGQPVEFSFTFSLPVKEINEKGLPACGGMRKALILKLKREGQEVALANEGEYALVCLFVYHFVSRLHALQEVEKDYPPISFMKILPQFNLVQVVLNPTVWLPIKVPVRCDELIMAILYLMFGHQSEWI